MASPNTIIIDDYTINLDAISHIYYKYESFYFIIYFTGGSSVTIRRDDAFHIDYDLVPKIVGRTSVMEPHAIPSKYGKLSDAKKKDINQVNIAAVRKMHDKLMDTWQVNNLRNISVPGHKN